ncbi:hypothetical protein [Pseudoruegeria sp. SHC-113]|uniref:hypothetical protein n=1 Tax=Pseudoruegeria sp. SHC-113 TaxID=2855439 RepID=UPI0021BB11AE|nr:hypothetical protein [Pseudoruegeria sp. SHC-113]MCT8159517.1 hypothetical protein [Pseudoruegeria sp. SHC-113]
MSTWNQVRLTAVALVLLGAQSVGANENLSVDDLAKELANPGAANATLNFKTEYRSFDGSLPGASDAGSLTFTFQPVFPFKLPNGNNLIFRPALGYVVDAPRPGAGGISDVSAWNDIPFDLLYSWQNDAWTIGAGIVGSVPIGSSVSSENWLLGPSFLAVRTFDWGVAGIFPFHNEKIGGSGPDASITSLQYFLFYGLGGGWQIGTGPTITYNWEAPSDDALTFPIQLAVSKTTAIGSQIVKLNLSAERNVIRPDDFSEDWTFTFTVSPVVKNPFQPNPPAPPVDAATRAAVLAPVR